MTTSRRILNVRRPGAAHVCGAVASSPRRGFVRSLRWTPAWLLVAALWAVWATAARAEVPAGDRPTGPILRRGEKTPREWVIPNGRIIRPIGTRTTVGGFPLGVALTPDQRYLLVTNCGAGPQSISVLDARTMERTADVPVKTLFSGIAVSADGRQVWVCGGGAENVQRFDLVDGKLTPSGTVPCAGYPTSCALAADGSRLYVTCNLAHCVRVVDTAAMTAEQRIETGSLPYGIALAADGRKAYVTNWADSTVSVLDVRTARTLRTLQAGGLPSAIVLTPDRRHAYVANANTDDLTVIDTTADQVSHTVPLSVYPGAPNGAVPNGLAFAPDGRELYVTLAGVNAVGVLSVPGHRLLGTLPTAWYPTGVVVARDGKALYVVSSKGTGSGPNKDGGHISRMMRGAVQRLDPTESADRHEGTLAVRDLNGFANSRAGGARPDAAPRAPTAQRPNDLPRGIKHVVFIVRENRTYDQVLGDLPGANGDPELALFGEQVTPNLHALARRFAIGDNMYGDGEVSVQGHQWTLGANCPDYVEKTWHALYSQRGRLLDAVPGPASYPALGYMMDHCVRNHLTCRMYGDTVRRERGGRPVPAMEGKVATDFPGWDLQKPDVERARAWLAEFNRGVFPQFSYIWLPNDHTAGTKVGMPTPRAMVADNDLATGIILEAISKHPEWRDTVVLLTEDDTQDGRDHVDAHRNVLLVASPWVRQGAVTSHHYSIASIYATIGRLLRLPPLSQFDDLADPIDDVWAPQPDVRPYRAVLNKVPLDEKNTERSPMSRESAALDLDEPDANTGPLLETILWQAMRALRRG